MISLPDGEKKFVGILPLVLTHTLESVINACAEAVAETTISQKVKVNNLSRAQKQSTPSDYEVPKLPAFKMPPLADCRRYDLVHMGGTHVA